MIIAVEGIDGAGKNTLVTAVTNQLRSQGHSVSSMTFPAYRQTIFADFADQALHGQLGDTADSAWAMALLFALDRKERREAIVDAARENDVLIIDRYVASNAAYSLARTQDPAIVEWIEKTEFGDFQLPLPDVQVCLATSVGVAADRARNREASDAQRTRDTYEKDSGLQERTLAAYQKFAGGSWQSPWLMLTGDDGADRLVEWISARLR
ncbi:MULTISPECIES: dTMP kinase [Corynebacterium]|uniref:Thymidylate kinase n=1 Tax=Corynebacterium amycolatum TaxID=43765 RepID=A0AB38XYF8_CORAY|nr:MULTISPECIES: dTMP kinase [Corynebacterium]OFN06929.1 thymidylate kinase [Corynebacterium sp. HMSC074C11]AIN81555.1 thymidylate kinase [Corynebacterium sp. ATCC 6931]MBU5624433.1 dTMP kinase [Corynebacterium amycolatum]MCT1718314.1 dTMP kinase [Corynebacterium amycolatum]MDY7341340.1 dTMP kinase [Corynebacterium amycolatum]